MVDGHVVLAALNTRKQVITVCDQERGIDLQLPGQHFAQLYVKAG